MSRLFSFSLQALARPFESARRRNAHEPAEERAHDEPERLERMAVYARAGYFNMGYTFDMFPLVGDLPPH